MAMKWVRTDTWNLQLPQCYVDGKLTEKDCKSCDGINLRGIYCHRKIISPKPATVSLKARETRHVSMLVGWVLGQKPVGSWLV